MTRPAEDLTGPHRFAVLLACCVVLLIAAGGLVKSLEAGLAVPDWPTSYGGFNPPRWWTIETVRAEHGHRLVAGTVALMTMALAVWLHRRDSRPAVRRLARLAVAAVLAQALLGGLTVLFFLPKPISISHAALAQIFLCLVVVLAAVTAKSWPRGVGVDERRHLLPLAPLLTGAIFVQILVGAAVRHLGAGLAIPDFPLAFGRIVPPRFTWPIAIHFAHRLGALAVAALTIAVIVRTLRRGDAPWAVRWPALCLGALVTIQIALGASIVWTGRAVVPNTVHVAVGALTLATSLVLSLGSWRLGPAAAARGATRLREVTL
jgi:cytochrome c oxidase assembly protein subunit 15